jgi:beta-glucanase (GH16 family)
MMKRIAVFTFALLMCSCTPKQDTSEYLDAFTEDFSASSSEYFQMGKDISIKSRTDILLLTLTPDHPVGAGRGPEIATEKYTHFGTYSTRLKVPDPREAQQNVGAVVGYFTYNMDDERGLSEIDFEWLIADPEVIYVGTWTGPRGNLQRVGRTLNLAEGVIYETTYREGHQGERINLTGEQNQPESIEPIEGFDASSQFHTYGFDWHPDRIRYWMIHPETADTLVLWDYRDENLRGIPQHESIYRMNFWHTDDWPVQTNPNSTERPVQPYELEVDWMSYEPF